MTISPNTLFPYFKLEKYDELSLCFGNGKRAYPNIEAAKAAAKTPGKYRITRVTKPNQSEILPDFLVD